MTWQLAVLLKMLGGSVLAPFAFRLLGNAAPRERVYRITLQFAWAAVFALVIAATMHAALPSARYLQVAFVGALMPLAVFFQWRAYAWSLSRGAIFMALMNIIPLVMSAVLLSEWRVFLGNTALVAGFAVAVLGVSLHLYKDIRDKRKNEKIETLPLAFYGNALAFKLIFGLAMFLENYWAKTGIETPEFLTSWYVGAFAGSLVFLLATRHLPRSQMPAMPFGKEQLLIVLAAAGIVSNLGLTFFSFQMVEQTVAMPIFAVGDIVGPMLVGMLVFGEWKSIRGMGWIYLSLGLAGAVTMALAR